VPIVDIRHLSFEVHSCETDHRGAIAMAGRPARGSTASSRSGGLGQLQSALSDGGGRGGGFTRDLHRRYISA
jgi:hypothetical protein